MRSHQKNSRPQGTGRILKIIKFLVPSPYIAAIYGIFSLFIIINIVFGNDFGTHVTANFKSYTPYTAETRGDIVVFNPHNRTKTIYKGRWYKVAVVFSTYQNETQYISRAGGRLNNQGYTETRTKRHIGPSIICVGHNVYAFIDAPKVEDSGFRHLFGMKKNKIIKIAGVRPDLDASLYSTDCLPPGQDVLDQLNVALGVTLPENAQNDWTFP